MLVDRGLVEAFTTDHRECDTLWTQCENALAAGQDATEAWERFDAALRSHLAMEEEVMFPAFEQATGIVMGPTRIMRMEHEQMRGVLGMMAQAMQAGDSDEVLDQGDTLLMLIQQHNSKEEGMLYPMAEQALASSWSVLATKLSRYR